jgi:hypothetical protein
VPYSSRPPYEGGEYRREEPPVEPPKQVVVVLFTDDPNIVIIGWSTERRSAVNRFVKVLLIACVISGLSPQLAPRTRSHGMMPPAQRWSFRQRNAPGRRRSSAIGKQNLFRSHVDPNELRAAPSTLRSIGYSRGGLRALSVRAPKEIMPATRRDQASDVLMPRKDAELRWHVLMVSDQPTTAAMPPVSSLSPTVKECSFAKGYQLSIPDRAWPGHEQYDRNEPARYSAD